MPERNPVFNVAMYELTYGEIETVYPERAFVYDIRKRNKETIMRMETSEVRKERAKLKVQKRLGWFSLLCAGLSLVAMIINFDMIILAGIFVSGGIWAIKTKEVLI